MQLVTLCGSNYPILNTFHGQKCVKAEEVIMKSKWSAQSFCQKPFQNFKGSGQVQSEVAHASMDNTVT